MSNLQQIVEPWWPLAVGVSGTSASLYSLYPQGTFGIILGTLLAASTACSVLGGVLKAYKWWDQSKPQDLFQARSASAGDMPAIMGLAIRFYKTQVSDMDRTKAWLKINRLAVHVIEKVTTYTDGRSVAEIAGYHCTIPISEKVANRILAGRLKIVDLEPTEVCKEGRAPRAIYIGSVLGSCKGAGAAATVSLTHALETLANGRPGTLLIGNPVTMDGLRLMRACGMQPHGKGKASELNVLHVGTLGDVLAALRSRIAQRRKPRMPDSNDSAD